MPPEPTGAQLLDDLLTLARRVGKLKGRAEPLMPADFRDVAALVLVANQVGVKFDIKPVLDS